MGANASDAGGSAVEVRGLARHFGRRWALAGLDVDVPRGGALMVTGRNGSGKTTLLRCLATVFRPHRGQVRLFGMDSHEARAALRPRIALLSHATRLYDDLDAGENLRIWGGFRGQAVDVPVALRQVGLDPRRHEPVRAYSAGMRRRLALALALMKRGELLLLDEPFSALDPSGRAIVGTVLRDERARGTTIVLATHLPAIAGPFCDAAIHLDAGQVVWRGAPKDAPTDLEPEPPPMAEPA
jgi:ABC-2 type transport system ATP-binding protein